MSKKSKSTSGPSKFAQPFITQGANTLQDAYNTNSGKIQGMADNYSGLIGDFATQRLQDGDTGVNAARDYGVSVLAGNYLNNNPHLQSVIDMTNEDVANQVNAQMGLKGLTGGSNHAGVLAKQISNNTANLRYTDYARERGTMDNAAGRAGSIAAADYLPVQGLLSSLGAQQAPLNAATQYAGGLGGLLGGYQTQTQPNGLLNNLLDAGASLGSATILASERRVKRDIQQVGTLPDGLGVFDFRYQWDSDDAPMTRGVMVDEVEKLRPWALGPVVGGIQTVDYSKLEAA